VLRAPCALILLVAGAALGEELQGFDLAGLRVPRELLVEGGPGREGIKAVDEPRFAAPEEAHWVAPDSPVLGVALGGQARAYPVHLLEWHQVVNDELASAPLVVTFDPIAGAPRAFRREAAGRRLDFGVSGLLYNSNFLLFDRPTGSLWSQWNGQAVAGPLAGQTLSPVEVRQEVFAAWLERHPGAAVLERPLPQQIDYRHSPFKAYWVADRIPFPVKAEDRSYHAKEVVVGVVVRGRARAYLGSRVASRGGGVEDEFQGAKLRIAYDTNSSTFRWEVPEGVEVGEAYWFAWKAWHPDTDVWGGEADAP